VWTFNRPLYRNSVASAHSDNQPVSYRVLHPRQYADDCKLFSICSTYSRKEDLPICGLSAAVSRLSLYRSRNISQLVQNSSRWTRFYFCWNLVAPLVADPAAFGFQKAIFCSPQNTFEIQHHVFHSRGTWPTFHRSIAFFRRLIWQR
jgi:hypothetical protein